MRWEVEWSGRVDVAVRLEESGAMDSGVVVDVWPPVEEVLPDAQLGRNFLFILIYIFLVLRGGWGKRKETHLGIFPDSFADII